METKIFHPEQDKNAVAEAAAILRRGGLLGIPTETVYGLGADALNEDAVRRIFEAKGRPQDNPLIIHVPSADWLERYCQNVPPAAYRLAERFWPGPLTMILPRRDIVPLRTTGGLETVGVRCPDDPVTLAIIEAAGVPVAAPSGNTSGRPSPTTAQHMMEDMMGRIEGIVDGGPCAVGVESTIIDLSPYSELFYQLLVGIGNKSKGQLVLFNEFLMRFGIIHTDTDYFITMGAQFRIIITQVTCLGSTTRCHIFRIKIKYYLFSFVIT